MRGATSLLACWALVSALPGCATQKTEEAAPRVARYAKPLPPGGSALRPATAMPDLTEAWRTRDALLLEAIDQSLLWFQAPSSQKFFPFEGISHERAEASLRAVRELLSESTDEAAFVAEMQRLFEIYESVGCDGSGTVLFTGYYSPIFAGSRTPGPRFTAPLYRRPADLATDPLTGEPLGRRTPEGAIIPCATRQEIEESGIFRGSELVWLENDLAAYIVHVNGSAKIRLDDGSVLYAGYAGKTDRPYASLGQVMVDEGLLDPDEVTLGAIKRIYRRRPEDVRRCMLRNEKYVFFTEYAGGKWPSGSLGVRVTPERSLATDKRIYPRGGLVVVETDTITYTGGSRSFRQFMLDQDSGGAIEAPGRADIFLGIGPAAEILAGGQYAEGRLYYFFLKPEFVAKYGRGTLARR